MPRRPSRTPRADVLPKYCKQNTHLRTESARTVTVRICHRETDKRAFVLLCWLALPEGSYFGHYICLKRAYYCHMSPNINKSVTPVVSQNVPQTGKRRRFLFVCFGFGSLNGSKRTSGWW